MIESLQALRAIAFIMIFLSHCNIQASSGPMGVSIFLVLSGFLMQYNQNNKIDSPPLGIKEQLGFSIKKISKLYPLHIITLFIKCNCFQEGLVKGSINLLLLQAWIPIPSWYFSYNAVSWYLSVYMFLLFCFPILYKKISKLKMREIILWLCVVLTLSFIPIVVFKLIYPNIRNDIIKYYTYIFPLYRIIDFILGMMLAKICMIANVKNKKIPINLVGATFLEIMLIVIWIKQIIMYSNGTVSPVIVYDLFWLPTSILAVYLFYKKQGIFTRLLSNRLTVCIGNISGVAFLIHQIVIRITAQRINYSNYIIAVIAFFITIIVSMIYKKYVKFELHIKDRIR